MTSWCIVNDSVASISLSELSSSSTVSDRACALWGCVLNASETTAVFQAENDLLENQFFVKTICLSEEAEDEMHIVAVSDGVGASKPLPIATLRHCMPMHFPAVNPVEMTEEMEEVEKEDEDS
ncbi:hypothetical protein DNTS_033843 [Danionella cerebrum]|uniref:Nucleoplasmin core domain-containing protein n=1 Tax=Danionella cerebrum TaxID=2873325 RepID=A0A553N5D2_9TELE|nr:hypothetical protein DNTS_033843 [Danionella translucida]